MTTNNTLHTSSGNWVLGTFNNYRVEAKVFEEASEYSLPGTTISILWITRNSTLVYSYDRGDYECMTLNDDRLAEIVAAVEAAR